MENAETILVVVLATFLAIFLVLAILLAVKCIQIANSVQRITDKAEKAVLNDRMDLPVRDGFDRVIPFPK